MRDGRKDPGRVLFVLSIDTEEEFDWEGEFPQRECSVENINFLPEFHQFCGTLGIRPTYLVDYPVASDPQSSIIMRSILDSGYAEVGAHLHPWCTPPIEGKNTEFESHVINLPEALVRQKLERLVEVIEQNLNVTPKVFRTGRWGIDSKVLKIVEELGFEVDSSVYPYYENQYFSCLNACEKPYWPDVADPNHPGAQRSIFEIPITSGFNRPGFEFWNKVHKAISASLLKPVRVVGLAWHSRFLRKLFLSPELASAQDMIALVSASLASGNKVVHMFLHSSTLLEERGEYNQHNIGRGELYDNIRTVVEHLTKKNQVEFCTVSEAARYLR